MATFTLSGRGVRTATAAALLLSLAAAGPARADTTTTDDPVDAAAGWLATALVDGERLQSEFDGAFYDAPGPTADAVYGLSSVGVAAGAIERAADWLETQVGSYTGAPDATFVGATAKLILVAEVTGRDPRSFGGEDLVDRLEAREVTVPDPGDPDDLLGRYRDDSPWGDFSSPLTQSLALLALTRVDGTAPSADAVQVLLDQQCPDGGFPAQFAADPCAGDVDTTGYAVQALAALGEDASAADAVSWLLAVQLGDGGFGSGGEGNANSTGLAAVALAVGGEDDAAALARSFLLGLQEGCDGDEPGAIVYSASDRGFVPLATAQALPGLTGESLALISAVGSSSDVPLLSCPEPEPVSDEGDTDEAAEEVEAEEASTLPDTGDGRLPLALTGVLLLGVGAALLRRVPVTPRA